MDYRILGPLEAFEGERRLSLGGSRQRAVLALLLLHRNQALGSDVIIDELWGEEPPPTAAKVLQNCVSALRKELPGGAETLRTVGAAYELRLEADELDRDRFERLCSEAHVALETGEHAEAAELLQRALALWRGSPLSDFAYERFAQDEITRLEEQHAAAIEDRIDADLALGRHAEVVPELEALVSRHPLRERARGQLMVALYRSGRQAEALEAYRTGRRMLLAELGIEPSRALQDLERAILAHDPALESSPAPRTAAAGRRAAPPLVGRERELALLEAGLDDALAGRGRLLAQTSSGAAAGTVEEHLPTGRGDKRSGSCPSLRMTTDASHSSRPSLNYCAPRQPRRPSCSCSTIFRPPTRSRCCSWSSSHPRWPRCRC